MRGTQRIRESKAAGRVASVSDHDDYATAFATLQDTRDDGDGIVDGGAGLGTHPLQCLLESTQIASVFRQLLDVSGERVDGRPVVFLGTRT